MMSLRRTASPTALQTASLLFILTWCPPPALAATTEGQVSTATAARYEYCEIEFIRGTSPWFPASGASDGGDRVVWSTATTSADARSWRELAGKMKIAMPDKTASARMVVLDALGGQGWELVSASVPSGQAAPASTWTFKRRLP